MSINGRGRYLGGVLGQAFLCTSTNLAALNQFGLRTAKSYHGNVNNKLSNAVVIMIGNHVFVSADIKSL